MGIANDNDKNYSSRNIYFPLFLQQFAYDLVSSLVK